VPTGKPLAGSAARWRSSGTTPPPSSWPPAPTSTPSPGASGTQKAPPPWGSTSSSPGRRPARRRGHPLSARRPPQEGTPARAVRSVSAGLWERL